uniref:Uncharacterized protein n=1 Tax=Phytophthora ramorum TaxID=164328 RepID=H3GNH5_PHYRM
MSTPTTSSTKTPDTSAATSAVVASMTTTAAASATTAIVIASTAMTTSAAAERHLCVAKYHTKWQEKHAIRNKTGKIIAVETGMSIYSPGEEGIPLNCESEIEEGEPEGDKDALSPAHKDSNVGLRRPREDDSNASGPKRSRSGSETSLAVAGALTTPRSGDDSTPSVVPAASRTNPVRNQWMPSQFEISSRFGAIVPPNLYALYSCNAIVDDDVVKGFHFDPMTDQRRNYYIGLFHELRWFASKKTSRRSKVPEWQALYQSWSAFVENFNNNPAGYRDRISQARECYEKFSKRVPYDAALRITERDVNGYTSMCVHDDLKTLRASFQAQASSSAEILSNEYENEPNLGSGSDDQQFAGRSSESPRVRLATGGGGGEKTPGFGQPDLESRLEAVERLQVSQFAALRQELSLSKAQFAEVAQTTSNVKIEVGTRLSGTLKRLEARRRARERVAELPDVGDSCCTYGFSRPT